MKRERTTPESPKRGRGRPKGQPKTGGRVKRTSIQIARDKARDSIWDYVVKGLSGQAVKSRGPTGKAISQPLTEDNQIRLLQTAWRKLEPDLNATAVSADIRSEAISKEPKDPRQVARAVLSVLECAKLAEQAEHPVAEPSSSWPEPPEQLRIGRDPIIELTANSDQPASTPAAALSNGEASGEVSPSFSNGSSNTPPVPSGSGAVSDGGGAGSDTAAPPPPDKKLEHGDIIRIESNGSHLWWDENRRKWACFCNNNLLHGWRADKEKALAHAASLPRGDPRGYQQHPFRLVTEQQIAVEPRRDNLGHLPRAELKIVRQRPR